MAWATPRTWVDDEVVTAAQLNQGLRDNFNLTCPGVVTTKGDSIIATGANTPARKAVGANGKILVGLASDASGWDWDDGPVPVGMIGLFKTACPAGWSEYTSARGRALVGVPASGTGEGTVGTALTDQEDKSHTHTLSGNHQHSWGTANAALGASVEVITVSNTPASPDVTGTATGSTAVSDIFPYIQLTVCQKD